MTNELAEKLAKLAKNREDKNRKAAETKEYVRRFMTDHPNMIIRYVRKRNGEINGAVIAISPTQIGWSKRRKEDKHSKHEAIFEAINKIGVEPCYSMQLAVEDMRSRAAEYFCIPTTIDVTQDDILIGLRCSSHFCPISLAINRHLKEGAVTITSVKYIHIMGTNDDCTQQLSNEAIKFIREFDSREEVEPFSFSIKIPERYRRSN